MGNTNFWFRSHSIEFEIYVFLWSTIEHMNICIIYYMYRYMKGEGNKRIIGVLEENPSQDHGVKIKYKKNKIFLH